MNTEVERKSKKGEAKVEGAMLKHYRGSEPC